MLEHLHLFSTNQIRTNYEQGNDYIEPYVSLVTEDDSIHYNVPYTPRFGDYLLSDLKTIVKQSEITQEQKPDAVGICIGQNPHTGKSVFINVDGLTNSTAIKFCTLNGSKLPDNVFTTYASSTSTGTIGSYNINDEVLLNDTDKLAGKITATRDISVTSGDQIYQTNDFAGLHNTIEWAKQAKAGGGTISDYPVLQRVLGYSGINSFDDVNNNYNGWFLASTGYGLMLCPSINPDSTSSANYTALKAAVENLGKTWTDNYFWGGSFCSQGSSYSSVHGLGFLSNGQGWGSSNVGDAHRVCALLEI